jgi:hypothetical protein
MWTRLLAVAALLATTTGCLTFERTRFSFDFRQGTGEVRFINVMSDNEMAPGADWAELVNDYIHGTKLEIDNPTWQIASKRLEANNGALDGVISLSFRALPDVGIFQFDKKAPLLWCAAQDQMVLSTDGSRTTPIASCVMWDRKAASGVVEVAAKTPTTTGRSLLPEFEGWDGARVEGVSPLGDLGGLGSAFGDALKSAFEGGPIVFGGLAQEQVMAVIDPVRAELQACGAETVALGIEPDGKATLTDTTQPGAACLAPLVERLVFPTASVPTGAQVPLP